ncbi:hypothetical protein CPB85DRAFT_1437725 [Mucidula mucida]|nr:hypothetical protein CPB85DRAFT_1437725 [Mucidula mucida]
MPSRQMATRPRMPFDIKWFSMLTPVCLPLTVKHIPSIQGYYDMFSFVDPAKAPNQGRDCGCFPSAGLSAPTGRIPDRRMSEFRWCMGISDDKIPRCGARRSAIGKALREDGVPMKAINEYRMHYLVYWVSWLAQQFRDIFSLSQEVAVGVYGFSHYSYRLLGEYAVPSTRRLQSWLPRYATWEINDVYGYHNASAAIKRRHTAHYPTQRLCVPFELP